MASHSVASQCAVLQADTALTLTSRQPTTSIHSWDGCTGCVSGKTEQTVSCSLICWKRGYLMGMGNTLMEIALTGPDMRLLCYVPIHEPLLVVLSIALIPLLCCVYNIHIYSASVCIYSASYTVHAIRCCVYIQCKLYSTYIIYTIPTGASTSQPLHIHAHSCTPLLLAQRDQP